MLGAVYRRGNTFWGRRHVDTIKLKFFSPIDLRFLPKEPFVGLLFFFPGVHKTWIDERKWGRKVRKGRKPSTSVKNSFRMSQSDIFVGDAERVVGGGKIKVVELTYDGGDTN